MNQTEKLFETDVLLRQCTAAVLSCTQDGADWLVETDRTVFFPEGGGQLSDTGSIGPAAVSHVSEREGRVLHRCDHALEVGKSYPMSLCWEDRLDHMQQHTGEHILSHALWQLFGVNNIGFHMSGSRQVTIDLDGELTPEQIAQAQDYANRQIWENHPVTTRLLDSKALDKLPMRKKTDKFTGLLRVVTVEGGDCCTCCGTHLPYTGMVGAIHILRQERYKGGVRLSFLCGRWALEDATAKNKLALELGAAFSAKAEELPQRVAKLKSDLTESSARLRRRTAQLWEVTARELLAAAPDGYICTCLEDCTAADAKALLQQLTASPRATAVVLCHEGDRVNYLVGCGAESRADCGFLCQLANGLFNGKGGGKGSFAQGSGSYTKDWRERAEQLLTAMKRG